MFFLHHAVCRIPDFIDEGANVCAVQRIDKMWYDWQHKDPRNKDVFAGGTVSWQVNTTQSFAEYPTGSPPWLNVRGNLWTNL